MTANGNDELKKPLFAFLIALVAWLSLVYSSLWSAIEIWIGNEIYNHCLIVIPASIYLIYEKRMTLDWSKAHMSWLAVFAFLGQLLLFVLGAAADIQLFQHVAIFSMLPTLVWIFIGNKLAWELKFPLAFVLFAVPVGEELIPFLQEITADMSVYMLKLSGIPLFRSGLFIEIPQGKFLVAEACSGVSFLIASIVLGNLYAYMNLISWRRRLFFLFLSIAFPILANSIRVYGIIYIGYSTDMEHAVGADHLIYGWFFFAFVLVCLFLLGELIRRNEVKKRKMSDIENTKDEGDSSLTPSKIHIHYQSNGFKPFILVVLFASLILSHLQTYRMSSNLKINSVIQQIYLDRFQEIEHVHLVKWIPKYIGNSSEAIYHLGDGIAEFDLYQAQFNGGKGELVSSLNRLYQQDRWTLVNRSKIKLNGIEVQREFITSSVGVEKVILYWYVVGDKVMSSYRAVKIEQLILKLKGNQTSSSIFAVAMDIDADSPPDESKLKEVASWIMSSNLAVNND